MAQVRIRCYQAEFTGVLQTAAEIAELDWLDSRDPPPPLFSGRGTDCERPDSAETDRLISRLRNLYKTECNAAR